MMLFRCELSFRGCEVIFPARGFWAGQGVSFGLDTIPMDLRREFPSPGLDLVRVSTPNLPGRNFFWTTTRRRRYPDTDPEPNIIQVLFLFWEGGTSAWEGLMTENLSHLVPLVICGKR